ncbi:uncharacterized protein LOC133191468 [Saccostrea echinata]|uniref:uncharacterized protein LOC133191468 n=1 Tax=Saccostrea echinata TaxID=191078 RepID=UPI002A8189C0|nr:uncharacterized protein LOC133191468 [Saccostrea echinata]
MIAAIRYNENSSRAHAVTRYGDLQYKVSFPKFKQGDYSTRKLTVEPTYGYTSTLMKETLKSATETTLEPIICLPSLKPSPLCSAFVHPEKKEAVCHFRSRFSKKETTV